MYGDRFAYARRFDELRLYITATLAQHSSRSWTSITSCSSTYGEHVARRKLQPLVFLSSPMLVSIVIVTYIGGSRQHDASNDENILSTKHISINLLVVVLRYSNISFFLEKQQNSITPTRTLNNRIVHLNIRNVLRAIDPIDNRLSSASIHP